MIAYLKKIEDFKPTFFFYLLAFIIFFISRLFFIKILNIDGSSGYSDLFRYLAFSNQILNGDFNLKIDLFIPAPLHYYMLAFFQYVFGAKISVLPQYSPSWWDFYLYFQILLLSLSSIYLFKLTRLIFKNNSIALIAWVIYFFYIPTSWFVAFLLQENNFQCFLIFFIYYFLKSLINKNLYHLFLSAILFSITFHIKSHILLFSLFIPIIILMFKNLNLFEKSKFIIIISLFSLISTIPYGYYNLKTNGLYVFSSSGFAAFFFVSHSDDGYNSVVNIPAKNSEEWKNLKLGRSGTWKKINEKSFSEMSQKKKDEFFYKEAFDWIRQNPKKTIKLKLFNLYNFLMPGVNIGWYDIKVWTVYFIISFPIYLFAYASIFINCKKNFNFHFWIFSLFLSMLFFNLVFITQHRFNVVTLDPFYIIFSSHGFYLFINYILKFKKTRN